MSGNSSSSSSAAPASDATTVASPDAKHIRMESPSAQLDDIVPDSTPLDAARPAAAAAKTPGGRASTESDSDDDNSGLPPTVFNFHVGPKVNLAYRLTKGRLFKHQVEALEKFMEHARHQLPARALIQLPTGAGKTAIAILAPYVIQARRVLVLTPSKIITEQMQEAFCDRHRGVLVSRGFAPDFEGSEKKRNKWATAWLPSGGQVSGGAEALQNALATAALVIINVQRVQEHTLTHPDTLKDTPFDLVIVDEAHHVGADTWKNILDWVNPRKTSVLYLTATPEHRGRTLINDQVKLIHDLPRTEAVKKNIIRDIELVEATGGATDEEYWAGIARKVEEALNEHDHLPNQRNRFHQALVLTADKARANSFVDIYNKNANQGDPRNIARAYYTGLTGAESILKRFKDGAPTQTPTSSFRVLVVIGCLLEGFDHANVSVVGIARPVGSIIVFTQFVGRALRLNRLPDGSGADVTRSAKLVSHVIYEQKANLDRLDREGSGEQTAEDREDN